MIHYVDPPEHPGDPRPYWLQVGEPINRATELAILHQVSGALGKGSALPLPRAEAQWGHKFVAGYLTLMFYDEADRLVAHMAISV